ncbi:MAG TPA: hypothetical protein VH276_13940 [Solirubrobacteraceae bacterium]|jgi:hypothetical protein|nr:hypothetical protein [Solirubrobacteraceae bacterium]
MPSARTLLAATAALAVLALPAAADAKPEHPVKHEHGSAKGHGHKLSLLLRGTYSGGELQVTGGNRATRRAGLVGQSVTLDLASAKLRVKDRNGDGARDEEDLQDGDRVVVQVRVARGDVASGTLTVRKLVAHADGGDDSQAGDDGADDPAENSGDDA